MASARNYSTYLPLLLVTIASASLLSSYFNIGQKLPSLVSTTTIKQNSSSTADVLVIGAGPAGLSAALTLYRHQHDIVIFDHGTPRNIWDTPTHVFPSWEGKSVRGFCEESKKELWKTGFVKFVEREVRTLEQKNDELFFVGLSDGTKWAGRKLLLAMGVQFVLPDIPGYAENFPTRIFHCLFTFGFEHRGSSSAGILAMGHAASPMHANILVGDARKFAETITVYTNGDGDLADAIKNVKTSNETMFDTRRIRRMIKRSSGVILEFEDGEMKEEQFLVHQPSTKVNPAIVKQLGLQLNERGDLVIKMPFYQTNVPGVFAAGDCASPFKLIANAVLMGTNAGAGIARELPISVTRNSINRAG
ncbi:FAD/NAD(P)-binding domain-containing protein [Glonium stellatum]|uniref:FAD/NAD(P)-binding domain-containing protein n=1 Tax=Glonium stellatum TaxID=574774 RepID=A0A8E2FCZ6_9PEZI|nr:FAD/NAD(P)-binding domain-containing protein [Glonium stellatum]